MSELYCNQCVKQIPDGASSKWLNLFGKLVKLCYPFAPPLLCYSCMKKIVKKKEK